MLSIVLLLLILLSGSFLGATFGRKTGRTYLITVFGSILLLFGFGLAGGLEAGFIVLCASAAGAYLWGLIRIVRSRSIAALRDFLTPALASIFLFAGLSLYLSFGWRVHAWDEYSHWAYAAKAVFLLNDLPTNPLSHALFRAYPPALQLFSYLLLKLNGSYSEWRLLFSGCLLLLSLFVPLVEEERWHLKGIALPVCAAVLAPLLFFHDAGADCSAFTSLYADAFLGTLFGCCLACLCRTAKPDRLSVLTLTLALAVLSLAKESGVGLAAVILCAVAVLAVRQSLTLHKKEGLSFRAAFANAWTGCLFACGFAVLLAAFLWRWKVAASGLPVSRVEPCDIALFFKTLAGLPSDYRLTVLQNFLRKLAEPFLSTGIVSLSPLVAWLLLSACIGLFARLIRSEEPERWPQLRFLSHVAILSVPLFCLGWLYAYMFTFSEYEAVRLASFSRYISTALCAQAVFVWVQLTDRILRKRGLLASALLLGLLVLTPWNSVVDGLLRTAVTDSQTANAAYQPQVDQISGLIGAPSPEAAANTKITVIDQGDTGLSFVQFHYALFPFEVAGDWSLGSPGWDGDIWSVDKSPDEWIAGLVLQGIDYVYLNRVDDPFLASFAPAFAADSPAEAQQLYRLEGDRRLHAVVR